jgi:hypothetical protein
MGGVAFWGDVLLDTCLARPFFLNTFALEALRNHLRAQDGDSPEEVVAFLIAG